MINIGKEKNPEELLIIYMEMIEKAIIFEDNLLPQLYLKASTL